ncbi:type VI secretion system baseplate subunit TssK [Pendulispora albinea]|uniref:Type VI secretion system baseplate subunit TssK n=1 Tax=Pendulispora albinea TaxID=2741071 RepID=A0ABZ2LS83_9BACT
MAQPMLEDPSLNDAFARDAERDDASPNRTSALDKPHWKMGMQLMPHHFQFQDSYHEAFVASHIDALFNHTWGILHVDVDEQAISSGHVSLRELRAILPGGLPIACGTKEAPGAPSRIVHHLEEGESLEVYVGVPHVHPGTQNVDPEEDPTSHRRYTRDSIHVADLQNGTREPVEIGRLRYNVTLLFEHDRLDDFVTLPIARVVRRDGQITFDEAYVPPVLQIRASRPLEEGLRRVLAALLNQQNALESMTARDSTETWRRWTLSVVSSHIATLADIVEQGHEHPHKVYRVLARLYGALSAFTPEREPTCPPFRYRALGETFHFLFDTIVAILDALGAEQYRRIPVHHVDANTYHVELLEPTIFRNEFFLCVVGPDTEMLRTHVPRTFRLAAWHQLAHVRQAAVAGVPLLPLAVPPASLPQKPGTVYFRLDKTSEAFEAVLRSGHLGIDALIPNVTVHLYAVDPRLL